MRDSAAIKRGKLRSCVCWIRFKSTCIPPVSQCQMQQLRTDYCLRLIITASFQHLMLSAGNHALEWRLILLRKTPNELRGGVTEERKKGSTVPPSISRTCDLAIHPFVAVAQTAVLDTPPPPCSTASVTPHPSLLYSFSDTPPPPCSTASVTPHPALQLQWHPTPSLLYSFSDTPPPPCSTASVTPHPLPALQLQWHPTPSLLYSFSDTPPPPCSTASVTPHPLPALQLQWHPTPSLLYSFSDTPPCSTASVTPHPLPALQLQWHPTPSLLYSFSPLCFSQFSSAQDDIYALWNARMHSTPSFRSFPNSAFDFQTVPAYIWQPPLILSRKINECFLCPCFSPPGNWWCDVLVSQMKGLLYLKHPPALLAL